MAIRLNFFAGLVCPLVDPDIVDQESLRKCVGRKEVSLLVCVVEESSVDRYIDDEVERLVVWGPGVVLRILREPLILCPGLAQLTIDEPLDFILGPFQNVGVEIFCGIPSRKFVAVGKIGIARPGSSEVKSTGGFVNGTASRLDDVDLTAGSPSAVF